MEYILFSEFGIKAGSWKMIRDPFQTNKEGFSDRNHNKKVELCGNAGANGSQGCVLGRKGSRKRGTAGL